MKTITLSIAAAALTLAVSNAHAYWSNANICYWIPGFC